jgi:ABC-2 type transport system ATP-binding protein
MLKVKTPLVSIQKKEILRNIDLEIATGEVVVLIGKNGSGKSTLIKYMLGLLEPNRGNVTINDKDVFSRERNSLLSKLGVLMVNQNSYEQLSVQENLEIYTHYQNLDEKNWKEYLVEFGLSEFENVRYGSLSSGNKQKTNLAILFLNNPTYIFLDEPFNALDRQTIIDIKNVLVNQNQDKNRTILIATHDFEIVEEIYDRVLYLKDGVIYKDLMCQEVKENHGSLLELYLKFQNDK